MAKLTREQVDKWNEGNKNGFQFDITYFLYHSEKTLSKHIEIDDTHVLQCQIMFRDEMTQVTNSYGCKYPVHTGKVIPVIHFAYSVKSGGMLVSHGLGYWHTLGEAIYKKNYKALQGFTEAWTDALCIATYEELARTKVNQYA